MNAGARPIAEPTGPSLRLCVTAAILATGALLFLWLRVVPVFEEVFRDFGRAIPALEIFRWLRPATFGWQALALLWIYLARQDVPKRQVWLNCLALFVAATVITVVVLMLSSGGFEPGEVTRSPK